MSQETNVVTKNRPAEHVDERPAIAPRVDVFESKEDVLLFADLPGVAKDAVDVRYHDGELTLEGARGEKVYRRAFLVPDTIDATKIEADLVNGVLRVKLPKAEAVKPRKIEVRAGLSR